MNWQRIKQYPIATYTLLIIQVLFFLWEEANGGSQNIGTLVEAGAKVNILVAAGEWWRLVLPMFIHIGWLHLIINSLTLYFVGLQLESWYGTFRFTIIYLLSGIGGNLMGFAFGNDRTVSAGASTALFGLFGVYVALGLIFRNQHDLKSNPYLLLIVINLVSDLFMSNVDIWGHVGGVLSGILLGMIVSLPQMKNALKIQWKLLSGILLLGLWFLFYIIGAR